MKRYRVAIVGLGRMGSTLNISVAEACGASDRLEVVAGADILAHRRDEFRQRWGVEAIYEDYQQMIEEQKPDLVAVCTTATGVQKPGSLAPSTSFRGDLHAEMTVRAANAGVPMVFCEKAVACSPRAADEILEACHRTGALLNTGVLMRFDDRFTAARDIIARGDIGEPQYAVAYTESNTLMHMHIHSLDMVSYLIGDPGVASVRGELVPRSTKVEGNRLEGDPHATYHVRFANGVEAWALPAGPRDFEVIGSEGMVRAMKSAATYSRWEIRSGEESRAEWFEIDAPAAVKQNFTTQTCLEDLVEAYETGRPARGNVDVTHNITEACLAVAESHRRGGEWVDLPMSNRDLYVFHV